MCRIAFPRALKLSSPLKENALLLEECVSRVHRQAWNRFLYCQTYLLSLDSSVRAWLIKWPSWPLFPHGAKLLPVITHAGELGSYIFYVGISTLPNLEFLKGNEAPQRRMPKVLIDLMRTTRSSGLKIMSNSNKLQSNSQHTFESSSYSCSYAGHLGSQNRNLTSRPCISAVYVSRLADQKLVSSPL